MGENRPVQLGDMVATTSRGAGRNGPDSDGVAYVWRYHVGEIGEDQSDRYNVALVE